jgi:hypothetical protein
MQYDATETASVDAWQHRQHMLKHIRTSIARLPQPILSRSLLIRILPLLPLPGLDLVR